MKAAAGILLVVALAGCSDDNGGARAEEGDDVAPPMTPEPAPNAEQVELTLSALEVVGEGVMTGSGTADVSVNLDDGAVTGTVTLAQLDAAEVTLSRGFAGETGPEVIALQRDSGEQWSFPANATLAQTDLDAFQQGGLYLQVTTADAPDGAVRGQLAPGDLQVLFTSLAGEQEVPPLISDASAEGAVTFDPETNRIVVHVNTTGLEDAVEAHIHDGTAGVNGPILTGLVQDPEDVSHWSLDDFELDADALEAFEVGELYLNVHTPANPGGEVRGQIAPAGVEVIFTRLSGDDVVPPVTTEGSGVAAATFIVDPQQLTLHVNLLELDDAETAELRQAPVMQNGPVVASLSQDPDNLGHWLEEDLMLAEAQHQALLSEELYVTVTTPEFPEGAVRGQLVMDKPPGEAFTVVATNPADGATVEALPEQVVVNFNRELEAASAIPAQVSVAASGGDGSFDEANEISVEVLGVSVEGARLVVELDTAAASDDVYQILLDGTSGSPLTATDGIVMDGDGDGEPGGDFVATFTVASGASAATLSQIQTETFTPSCALSGCHTGSTPPQGLDLSEGQAFANLVGVPSAEVPSLNRVEPGDPDDSYLVRKVEGTASVGSRMPLGRPALSNAQIQNIRDWIAAGAEND